MTTILRRCLLLALVLFAVQTVYALSATDNFTGTNGNDINSANWTAIGDTGLQKISSNRATSPGGAACYCASVYNGAWANNQESIGVIHIGANDYYGLGVRMSGTFGSSSTYYNYRYTIGPNPYNRITKSVAGVESDLTSDLTYPADLSTITLRVVGTTITVLDDGVDISGGGVTDSSITSGKPGMVTYDSGSGTSYIDDWAGNDIGGGTTLCQRSLLGIGCEVQLFSQRIRQ